MALSRRPRLLLACTATLLAASQAQPNEVIVSETCPHQPQDILEGLAFRMMGRTKSGAPWYQSVEHDLFLYFDPDCSGGGDGAGWIIDDDQPNVGVDRDLDVDGDCQYLARARWGGTRGPPKSAMWFIRCADGWRYQALKLTENPEVHEDPPTPGPKGCCPPPKTTMKPGFDDPGGGRRRRATTTGPPTTTDRGRRKRNRGAARSEPTSTVPPQKDKGNKGPPSSPKDGRGRSSSPSAVTLSQTDRSEEATAAQAQRVGPGGPKKLKFGGACGLQARLNGAIFEMEGRNIDGAPFYKARGSEKYVYHSTTCDEGDVRRPSSRWILDDAPPRKRKKGKKDAETQCDYNLAHLEDAIDNGPPSVATWRMVCGDSDRPVELTLTLREATEEPDVRRDAPIVIAGGRRGTGVPPLALLLASLLLAALAQPPGRS